MTIRTCKQCGKPQNPVQVMLSGTHGVCGDCCRRNHRAATGAPTDTGNANR